MMRWLWKARVKAGGVDGITTKTMTPAKKCILTTKVTAGKHENIINSKAYEHGILATTMWLPVCHLMKNKHVPFSRPDTVREKTQVQLQHPPKHIYLEQCNREAVYSAIDTIDEEKAQAEKDE